MLLIVFVRARVGGEWEDRIPVARYFLKEKIEKKKKKEKGQIRKKKPHFIYLFNHPNKDLL